MSLSAFAAPHSEARAPSFPVSYSPAQLDARRCFVIEGARAGSADWTPVGWSDEAGRDLTQCDSYELALERIEELRDSLERYPRLPAYAWKQLRIVGRGHEASQLGTPVVIRG